MSTLHPLRMLLFLLLLCVVSSTVQADERGDTYDNDDNVTGITDNVTPTNSQSYGYDVRGRLSQAIWQAGSFAREDILHDANVQPHSC